MTRVDLDAVLKLQRDYTTLDQRLTRLFEWVVGLNQGINVPFLCGDDRIEDVAHEILKLYKKIPSK